MVIFIVRTGANFPEELKKMVTCCLQSKLRVDVLNRRDLLLKFITSSMRGGGTCGGAIAIESTSVLMCT